MSYRGRASYNRAPNCASRNTKPYIVTFVVFISFLNFKLTKVSPPDDFSKFFCNNLLHN